MKPVRRSSNEVAQRAGDLDVVVNEVQVVDHEDGEGLLFVFKVHQKLANRLHGTATFTQPRHRALAAAGGYIVEGKDHTRPKLGHVAVGFVKGEPCDGH